jgi:hypothetical protein
MREVLIRGRAFLIRGEEVNELLISDKVLRLRNFLSSFGAFREGRNKISILFFLLQVVVMGQTLELLKLLSGKTLRTDRQSLRSCCYRQYIRRQILPCMIHNAQNNSSSFNATPILS